MMNISKLTTNLTDIVTALNGKWEYKNERDRDGTVISWVILGKIVFTEDENSRDRFPYSVISWHLSDNGYWGILK